MMDEVLSMKFDPNTIEHLGVKMYSRVPTAVAELIANAYDADATKVFVHLENGESKRVIVEDNGAGMTFEEVNNNFLKIGRNRRKEGDEKSPSGKRRATGRKGLGKLALFGIGEVIEVETVKGGTRVVFKMEWSKLKDTHDKDYEPEIVSVEEAKGVTSGTKIILSNLKRRNDFNEEELAASLSKLFNFFDKDFQVFVKNEGTVIPVNNELKYSLVEEQFFFNFPDYLGAKDISHTFNGEIKGKIITSEKPLNPGMRGITLFANGRLVNAPEFFGRSESSHFYSYVTGWLEVDFLDDWEEDVISTNRQSLNWEAPITSQLKKFFKRFF